MPQEVWYIGGGCFFGMAAALVVIDFIGCIRRRWRGHRKPVTKGKLDLFDDDGEGHFLSAKLPVAGLEQLLKDINRGRFG